MELPDIYAYRNENDLITVEGVSNASQMNLICHAQMNMICHAQINLICHAQMNMT
jgi:hypothetical protein